MRIVLGPDDAPDGTAYVDAVSGFQDLDAFARDDAERSHLVDDGFEVGHLALFFPAGHTDGGAPEPLSNDSVIVQGMTGLFHDADGAESSLERYVQISVRDNSPTRATWPPTGWATSSIGFGARHRTGHGCRSSPGGSAT